ncbi:MAG: hypothetical protein KDA92_04795, partial [Planctomycetales bacterium]|nr:hypothetical protein [Planctomycetales bacterium]
AGAGAVVGTSIESSPIAQNGPGNSRRASNFVRNHCGVGPIAHERPLHPTPLVAVPYSNGISQFVFALPMMFVYERWLAAVRRRRGSVVFPT